MKTGIWLPGPVGTIRQGIRNRLQHRWERGRQKFAEPGLLAKRVNARVHVRKIVALVEMHGRQAVARAMDDGLELQAFGCEYIANILGARRRIGPEPAALQLTRRADLLELEMPEPDLSIHDKKR